MKHSYLIGRLVLLLIVAIGSTIGLVMFLCLEFKDFEWGNDFWECLVSLFSSLILLVNHITVLIGMIVGAAWYGVIITIKKLLNIKEKHYHETYTGVDEYDIYEDHTWDNYD